MSDNLLSNEALMGVTGAIGVMLTGVMISSSGLVSGVMCSQPALHVNFLVFRWFFRLRTMLIAESSIDGHEKKRLLGRRRQSVSGLKAKKFSSSLRPLLATFEVPAGRHGSPWRQDAKRLATGKRIAHVLDPIQARGT